jgi:Raf kinase inhibitor-like YbhB/YbcL family protein
MTFALESPAFRNGGTIPQKYARRGENLSPPLEWKNAPPGTKSFVLIVEDPDAPSGTFRHWAVYNIDVQTTHLPEGAAERLPSGVNDFGNPHYDGPQPPKDHGVHQYHFRIAALDKDQLNLPPGAKVVDVWRAAKPHILAEAELVGTYETK